MKRNKDRPRPQMNVTPLVDVVLVLLIIFMVVIPAMNEDGGIQLPAISNVDKEPKSKTDPILLAVDIKGQLVLEKRPLARADAAAMLLSLHRQNASRRLLMRMDKSLPYGQARELFALGQSIGFPGVSLRVQQRGDR